MINIASWLKGLTFGGRDEALSIPIMDGPLKPNNLLEDAAIFAERQGLEDIAIGADDELYAACGPIVARVGRDGIFSEVARFDRDVTALAAFADGRLAAALGNAVILDITKPNEPTIVTADGRPFNAVNALTTTADGSLLISDGSMTRPYSQWNYDLLEKGRTGRVLSCDAASGRATTLASRLACAFGVFVDDQGGIFASESWRHQIIRITPATGTPAVQSVPGYPARMARAAGGGFWLSVFAARTQLVEFVLCENDFRREMMSTVDPRYWVAPALSSGDDFLEPLQGGGVKQMGILKPWAPPRSYGLVIRIGDDFIPKFSLHSRSGGKHHGVVAVAERGDELFVLSKGAGRILRLSVRDVSERISA